MRLIVASNNKNKIKEIRSILGGVFGEIVSLREAGVDADILEDGDTFEANALKKAEGILALCDYDAAISDDSGICVEALGGAPGIFSARYALGGHDDEANNNKLLFDMKDVPQGERAASFVCAVALARRGLPSLVCRGEVHGELLFEPRGNDGFGYDPLFFYPPFGRSFAELTSDEKNAVSHRRRALEALLTLLNAEKAGPRE